LQFAHGIFPFLAKRKWIWNCHFVDCKFCNCTWAFIDSSFLTQETGICNLHMMALILN
jgi:hypothetical protein